MPAIRVTKHERESLLKMLRAGHDVDSAGAVLGLTTGQMKVAMAQYQTQISQAFKTGTARLRAQIMDNALSDNNAPILLKLLEQREKETALSNPITHIERVIMHQHYHIVTCAHCGKENERQPLNGQNIEPINLQPLGET